MTDPTWTPRLIGYSDLCAALGDDLFDRGIYPLEVVLRFGQPQRVVDLFAEVVGGQVDHEVLFKAMKRVFGEPNLPEDLTFREHMLSTCKPDMVLRVRCWYTHGQPAVYFFFAINEDTWQATKQWPDERDGNWREWPEGDPMKPYVAAAIKTLRRLIEMIGPVARRETSISSCD